VAYRPSPRPTFPGPAAIPFAEATRHVWGDDESGHVDDWIYASTERIHALVFGLPPGGAFRHSDAYRTVFAADELLHVLEGTLVIANPETGEVHRAERGESVFFRRDTWHHAFAYGTDALRVLELFAPPPAAGASGAYARTRPYLTKTRYADDALLGHWPGGQRERSMRVLRSEDVLWRLDGGVLVGILASTEHLTAGTLRLLPGQTSAVETHGGDEILCVLEGTLHARVWDGEEDHLFEIGPQDAFYAPLGTRHEYRNEGNRPVDAIFGVAPSYLP
jgi:quercetin dioxygenase-like cupin family protein